MKFPILIQISWHSSIETVLLETADLLKVGDEFLTTELWEEREDQVCYVTRVLKHNRESSRHELVLEYLASENPEIAKISDCWGTSTIIFDTAKDEKRSAKWQNNPPRKDYDGTVSRVRVMPAGEKEFLGYVTVFKRKRRQEKFRRVLRTTERKCALSGESELSVLDAAHIVDVGSEGNFTPTNGFLLRTDLHRLFDKGLLQLDPETGEASLSTDVPPGSEYWKAVGGWKLRPSTLKRVRKALLDRANEGGA